MREKRKKEGRRREGVGKAARKEGCCCVADSTSWNLFTLYMHTYINMGRESPTFQFRHCHPVP